MSFEGDVKILLFPKNIVPDTRMKSRERYKTKSIVAKQSKPKTKTGFILDGAECVFGGKFADRD